MNSTRILINHYIDKCRREKYSLPDVVATCLLISGTSYRDIARKFYKELRLKKILPYSYRKWHTLDLKTKSVYDNYMDIDSLYRFLSDVHPMHTAKEILQKCNTVKKPFSKYQHST